MTKTGHFCNVEEKYSIALPPKKVDPPIPLPPKKVDPPMPLPPITLPPYGPWFLDWQENWLQKNVIKSLKLTLLFSNTYHGTRHDDLLKLQSAFGTAGTLWLA